MKTNRGTNRHLNLGIMSYQWDASDVHVLIFFLHIWIVLFVSRSDYHTLLRFILGEIKTVWSNPMSGMLSIGLLIQKGHTRGQLSRQLWGN